MLASLLGAALAGALPPIPAHDKPVPDLRVGRIIIEGNRYTLDGDILEELDFRPGQPLPSEADILRAEMRLLMAFHKRFDLADRQRPRIEFEAEKGSNYIDIRVLFPEKKRKKDKP
jgi:hypothetical protein